MDNLTLLLETFPSDSVGLCYDSCHHFNESPAVDLLERYGDRLAALHLHDNGGKHDQHRLPFDGDVDWPNVMRKIAKTGYTGAVTLEPMNWDYESMQIREYLDIAHKKAKQLERMMAVAL